VKNTADSPQTRVRLDQFDPGLGLDRGRSRLTELCWYLTKCVFFLSPLPWPQVIKHSLLKLFGAKVGKGVVLKPRVNIHLPWKLSIGDYAWIGEEAFILNFEPIHIGAHACISQRVFLCGGNHDFSQPDFRYRNGPITVKDGAWIGAQSFISPNSTIGVDTVVSACSQVSGDLPEGQICGGVPCKVIKPRWKD